MIDNILPLKHTDGHAKLSASGSHRWILCPGSVAAEEGLKEAPSYYANEGTLAHELAERMLLNKDYSDLEVTTEMIEYVNIYVNHLQSIITSFETLFYIEKKVDYSNVVAGGFGTADAIVLNKTENGTDLSIVDFKYGKGVKVEAYENTQLILYALGALNTLTDKIEKISQVHFEIVQPRMYNISKWTISFEELKVWEGYLKAKGEAALQPNAPRIPSEKACQWCKAFTTCRAPYETVEDLLLHKTELTEEEIGKVLDNSKLIIKFITDLENRVYQTISSGQKFKGYKLIEGKGIRKLKEDSEEKLVELLGSNAYDNKLIGVLKLEKLLGKEVTNSLTYYSHGKPLLVKESDRREAITLEEMNYDVA